jgi:type IV pilus assembly protein PilC
MIAGLYYYTGRSSEGRFVSGSLQAETYEQALAHLRMRSLFVTSLEVTGSASAAAVLLFALLPLDRGAQVAFFRAFATLVASGVTVRRALDVTIEQCRDPRLSEALQSVAGDIEAGSSLSSAMARRPREFTELFVAMIRAGELAGALDEVLERLAGLLERDRAVRKRLGAALAYPVIVTLAALGLVLFLVANTVPAFAAMFQEMHVDLPLSTRILIMVGDALKEPLTWSALAVVPIAAILAVRFARTSQSAERLIDRLRTRLPIFGPIVRKATIAQLARTLGTLLRSGVPLLGALDAASDAVDNGIYRDCIRDVALSLRHGDPITAPLERSGVFEPLFVQLVRVGEETGALDAMLLKLADYYEFDVETAIATLGSVLEPVLIVVLGAIVGTIVTSILIPLYSIIGSIK